MKRLLSFICIVLAVTLPPLSAQEKGPSIVFDSVNRNVGRIPEGETIRNVFKFTNKGSAPLDIISVDASCGCTSALLSKNRSTLTTTATTILQLVDELEQLY